MNITTFILLAFFHNPAPLNWEPMSNRTIQVTTTCNGVYYHSFSETRDCRWMQYVRDNEVILKAVRICYRVSKQGFKIK